MKKVSDYIIELLEENGIATVFLVTGGGAMYLNDSFGQSKQIRKIFNHHEQGSAIAAEGYARTAGRLAVTNVTSGPGALNTLTGVMGQWTDSVPVLYLSGQVRYDTTVESQKGRLELRQMGDQEVDIIPVIRPLTKFAATIKDPQDVKWIMEKAIHEATTGRPGPVWVNVPHNIQSAVVDENNLLGFEPGITSAPKELTGQVRKIIQMLSIAKRPLVVCGRGTRISGTIESVRTFCKEYSVPIVTTFNNYDAIPDDFSLYSGRIGTIGQRAGNFCLQNADIVLFLGTRNNIRQVSYTWTYFCRAAKRIAVDIDDNELRKPLIIYDLAIRADLRDFMPLLLEEARRAKLPDWSTWVAWCQERKRRFPVITSEQCAAGKINPYYFVHELTKKLGSDAVIVAGNGTASVCLFQSSIVKDGQRILNNSGCAAMGYDLPAALGAACVCDHDVICLAGDGSFQMNLQELATISYNHLPVKIFYLDNGGYASIRQTQDNFFGRRFGINNQTGIAFPDTAKLAEAYGLTHFQIGNSESMAEIVDMVLKTKGPALCHVYLDPEHIFEPKLSSARNPAGQLVSKPLEDMYPFLPRDVLKDNMIIDVVPED